MDTECTTIVIEEKTYMVPALEENFRVSYVVIFFDVTTCDYN